MHVWRADALPVPRDRSPRPQTRSAWYWYRDARSSGKPMLWSVRYARAARRTLS